MGTEAEAPPFALKVKVRSGWYGALVASGKVGPSVGASDGFITIPLLWIEVGADMLSLDPALQPSETAKYPAARNLHPRMHDMSNTSTNRIVLPRIAGGIVLDRGGLGKGELCEC